jgi:hypothetical protein
VVGRKFFPLTASLFPPSIEDVDDVGKVLLT